MSLVPGSSGAGASTSGGSRPASSSGIGRRTSGALHAAALLALLVAAAGANIRRAGTSPIVWIDTSNDDSYVAQCLHDRACTLTGVATSVPGKVHAVAWLELRSLLAYWGADDDAVHVAMLVLAALGVVLTFEVGRRLGGPLAGVATAWLLGVVLSGTSARLTALYNTSVLGFLGSVLVLICTAAVERGGAVAITLAALLAAVMANVHIGCLLAGVSVVWAALQAPSRRLRLAGLGFAVFVLATFAIAPPSWIQNVSSVGDHQHRPGGASLGVGSTIRLTAIGVGAWLWSLRDRRARAVAWRRRMQGALAVAVPVAVASFIWPLFGMEANVKYLAHIEPAAAVLAGVPIGMAADAVLRRVIGATSAMRVIEAAAPFALALYLPLAAAPIDDFVPTVHDLTTVADVLRRDYRWEPDAIVERLRSPNSVAVLTALRRIAMVPDASPGAGGNASTAAIFVTVPNADVPAALPPDWRIIRRGPTTATVLIVLESRVDWRSFEICMQGDDGRDRHCAASGFVPNDTPVFSVANMPTPGQGVHGTLSMRLTIRPGRTDEAIFMPRLRQTCGGYIVDAQDPVVRVAADRRHAVVGGADDARPATVTLAWELGSPECRGWAYDGPPFVVAGDAHAVAQVESVLRDQAPF